MLIINSCKVHFFFILFSCHPETYFSLGISNFHRIESELLLRVSPQAFSEISGSGQETLPDVKWTPRLSRLTWCLVVFHWEMYTIYHLSFSIFSPNLCILFWRLLFQRLLWSCLCFLLTVLVFLLTELSQKEFFFFCLFPIQTSKSSFCLNICLSASNQLTFFFNLEMRVVSSKPQGGPLASWLQLYITNKLSNILLPKILLSLFPS